MSKLNFQVYSLEKVNFPLVIEPYNKHQRECTVIGVSGYKTDGPKDDPDLIKYSHTFNFLLMDNNALPSEKRIVLQVSVIETQPIENWSWPEFSQPWRLEQLQSGKWRLRDVESVPWEVCGEPEPRFNLTEEEAACFPVLVDPGAKPDPKKITYNSTQRNEVLKKWPSYKKSSGRTSPPIDGFYQTNKKQFEGFKISEEMARRIIKNENVSKCKQKRKDRAAKRGAFHDPIYKGKQ